MAQRSTSESPTAGGETGAAGFARQVAGNLRRLRQERGWSLEELSTRAGVSRAMLSQVETGKTTPTIAVLWKIATGFGVPFTELLREEHAQEILVVRAGQSATLASADRRFRSQPLTPPGRVAGVELYRISIDPGGISRSPAHAAGTVEVVSLERGRLRLTVGAKELVLEAGDSACFGADVEHAYAAVGAEGCLLYDLVRYPPSGGGTEPVHSGTTAPTPRPPRERRGKPRPGRRGR